MKHRSIGFTTGLQIDLRMTVFIAIANKDHGINKCTRRRGLGYALLAGKRI
jgi:hypothetical protein